jgi:Fic family protein
LDYLLKGSKDEDLPNDNPQLQLSEFCHILEKSNPLRNTENSIERISAAVESILSNQGTTVRGMKLIANSLLAVSILEKLEAQEPVPLPTSQQHATMSLNFFPIGQYLQKPLILEEVRTNDQLSYFIN